MRLCPGENWTHDLLISSPTPYHVCKAKDKIWTKTLRLFSPNSVELIASESSWPITTTDSVLCTHEDHLVLLSLHLRDSSDYYWTGIYLLTPTMLLDWVLPWLAQSAEGGNPIQVTQPCIPPRSLNLVPSLATVKAGKSPLPGNTVWSLMACDFLWRCGNFDYELLYLYLLTFLQPVLAYENTSSDTATQISISTYVIYILQINLQIWRNTTGDQTIIVKKGASLLIN